MDVAYELDVERVHQHVRKDCRKTAGQTPALDYSELEEGTRIGPIFLPDP